VTRPGPNTLRNFISLDRLACLRLRGVEGVRVADIG